MLARVEGHTGAARVRRMACSNRVVKPVCAVASRIWRVRGELRACRGTWRWGDKSRPRGMRSAILNGRNLRNHVIATARCPFGFSHRSCDEVSKWAVPLLGYAKQTAGKRAIRGAQRVPRRSAVGRSAAAAVGRPVGGGHHAKRWTRCGFSLRFQFQSGRRENARISRQFQFKPFGTLPNLCLPENKVDASRRAEKCRSLRVRKRGKVEMRPSAMRAGRPCTAQGLAESARSDTATQPGTTSSGPQA